MINRHHRVALTAALTLLTGAASAQEMTLKLAHNTDPADPVHTAAQTFASVVAEETGGEVEVQVYPAAQLGKTKDVQEGVQQGFVDIVIESIGTLSTFHPVAGVESMPYLFRDGEHYVRVWEGDVGQEIKQLLADEANFRILGHMYRGSRELTSNRKVDSIEDLDGLKIRVTPLKERLVTWQTFGASPTPMAFSEVFTALEQGVIDAQENPIPTIAKNSFFEVQDYLVLTSHMANGFTFQMNAETFDGYDEDVQEALRAAAEAAAEEYNQYVRENEKALLQEMADEGMEIVEVDRDPFRAKADEVVAEFPDLKPWYDRMTEVQ